MDFCLSVAKALLEGHFATYQQRNSSTSSDLPLRLNSRCFLEQIRKETQYGGLHQCVVCWSRGRRSQTRYRCKNCLVALHIERCFELFHTKLDYSTTYRHIKYYITTISPILLLFPLYAINLSILSEIRV